MLFIRGYRDSDKDACAHICRATLPPSLQDAPDPRVRLLAPYVWTHQFTYLSPGTCHVLVDSQDGNDNDNDNDDEARGVDGRDKDKDKDKGSDNGKVVGYCIGCPDVLAMRRAYARYVDDVLLRDNSGGVASPEHERRGFVRGARVEWMVPAAGGGGGQGERQRMVTNPRALEQLAFRGDLLLGHPVFTKPALLQHQQQQRPLSSYRAMMHIDLLPEAQGRGWGRKLIDRFVESVVQAASATGAQADGGEEEQVDYGSGIWIGVSPENRKVLAFYERVGFRLVMNDDEEGVVLVKDIPAAAAVRG